MYVEYEEQCGNCIYYDFQGDNSKGYCSWYKSYYYPGDSCSHQEKRQRSTDSSCYITTIVCNLLGYDDDCGILETLRGFRENIMHKDEKYKEMLHEYDIVGPQIAESLQKDFVNNQDKELVNSIFNFYIQPTAKLVDDKKYDLAVERYKEMTKTLKEYYGISYDGKVPNNYDYQQGGHGKVILKSLDNK